MADEPLEERRASARNLVAEDDETVKMSPEERKKEKRKITKNVFIISFGFLFLFTAFQSLQNLQSSLNKDEGLGLTSLSVIYGALILSCILVPPLCDWETDSGAVHVRLCSVHCFQLLRSVGNTYSCVHNNW